MLLSRSGRVMRDLLAHSSQWPMHRGCAASTLEVRGALLLGQANDVCGCMCVTVQCPLSSCVGFCFWVIRKRCADAAVCCALPAAA